MTVMGGGIRRYPVTTSPAAFIACPRHGLAVALGEDGRIVSTCPACVRQAKAAEAKIAARSKP